MTISDIFKNSKGEPPSKNLVIVGVNPIIDDITENPTLFFDLLVCNPKSLKITIIYESDDENFNQSLFYDKKRSRNKIDLNMLQVKKRTFIGSIRENSRGFTESVLKQTKDKLLQKDIIQRLRLFENNRINKVNLIMVDDIIWYSISILDMPTLEMYKKVTMDTDSVLYEQFANYIDSLLNIDELTGEILGNVFLSREGEELIQMYDHKSYPRGIAPRKAFYSSDFYRYSIWAFIFNRNGELLLHKRSNTTVDNRSLWDKSAGGHVDLTDSSTMQTAKRELIEEIFLSEAEHTEHITADVKSIIDFGEWNISSREAKNFIDSFNGLNEKDWIAFRATEYSNEAKKILPMTIRRKSLRKMHVKDRDEKGNLIKLPDGKVKEHVETLYSRFISDVFLFIAPIGKIDNEEQMKKSLIIAEKRGSASAHKLYNVSELIDAIEDNPDIFTDDLVYICSEKKNMLIEFSEAIKYILKKDS